MSASQPDIILDSAQNSICNQCKNKAERKQFQDKDQCGRTQSVVDGLPVRCVGGWAFSKIYRLVQYFGIFAQGMHKKWNGQINYIEICSGPGRCILRESGGEEINGTALAVLKSPKFQYVSQALFVDRGNSVVDALNTRIQALNLNHKARAVIGDYTNMQQLESALGRLNPNHLNLVMIDPTECNVPFDAIRLIADKLKNVDFIINVALGTDVNRNLVPAILDASFEKVRSKYAAFLGDSDFFDQNEVREAAEQNRLLDLRRLFAEKYAHKLGELGYMYTDTRPVRHYYYLLFASRSVRGLEFWRKACTYAPSGQKEFF